MTVYHVTGWVNVYEYGSSGEPLTAEPRALFPNKEAADAWATKLEETSDLRRVACVRVYGCSTEEK